MYLQVASNSIAGIEKSAVLHVYSATSIVDFSSVL